jgi:hypothetical protein
MAKNFQKYLHISFIFTTFASPKVINHKKNNVMLGFSASKGVEIKGRFANEMRETMKRVRSGRLNKADRAALHFQQETGDVVLVRE